MSALEGASKYLNNLLLARGLLQNGKPIDFAHPAHGDETTDATMSKVINLVHDLILRRDREAEHRETMAASISNMRATEAQHIAHFRQMENKNQHAQSELSTAQSQERSTKESMKRLERQIKELKEQNLKMKSMLDQVRARCISDVRKRDVEIEKLKGHLVGIQRGKKESSGMKISSFNLQAAIASSDRRSEQDTNSTDWSLEKETNDFLAKLVNETSTENVALRRMIDDTLNILMEMSGVEQHQQPEEDDAIGIPGQYRNSRKEHIETLVPVEELVTQMNDILQHCRTILKDPSFVPIEEVQVREEEILKLRAGWERMADRWKEAVMMMGQWKQKMLLDGNDADVGDLSDLSFGRSVATRPDGQPVLIPDGELSMINEESMAHEDHNDTGDTSLSEVESDLDLEPQPSKRLASSPAKRGVKLLRPTQPLGVVSGNTTRFQRHESSPVDKRVEYSDTENCAPSSRVSPNRRKLTVNEKLAAVQAEATKVEARRSNGSAEKRKSTSTKKRTTKSSRRRSTLSPEELATMMAT